MNDNNDNEMIKTLNDAKKIVSQCVDALFCIRSENSNNFFFSFFKRVGKYII